MKETCFYYLMGYCCCGNLCDHDKKDFENCEKYKEAVKKEREESKDKGMTDMEIELYEAEHQPSWLLDLESSDTVSAESEDEE